MPYTSKTLFPKVGHVAHLGVTTTAASTSVHDAIALMISNDIRDIVFPFEGGHRIFTVSDLLHYRQQGGDFCAPLSDLPPHQLEQVHEDDNILNIFPKLDNEQNRYLGVTSRQGKLTGIVSYSDVVSALDPSVFIEQKSVGEILRPKHLLHVDADTPTDAILFRLKNVEEALIATYEDRPVGILTAKDAIRIIQQGLDTSKPVAEFMNSPVDTVDYKDTISQVLAYLKRTGFKRAIVIDEEQKLMGALTQSDLAGFAFNHWTELVHSHTSELSELTHMLEGKARHFEHEALSDPLTGLSNRRKFNLSLRTEISRISRYGTESFSLVMLDIDHFKHINDQYGHLKGDEILRALALAVSELLRETDLFCRWGGEEFIILLPVTGVEGAYLLAERIRARIRSGVIEDVAFTLSSGVGQYVPGESGDELIQAVDEALYRAKHNGRDRVALREPADVTDEPAQT